MVKMDEELRVVYDKWLDFIVEEIDHLKMDNIAKVNEILALKNAIRENKDILDTIKVQLRMSIGEMPDIERKVDDARDYAAYVLDIVDKIEDYDLDEDDNEDDDDDEDDEPIAYCDNCGAEIYDEDEVVYGEEGEYCCNECLEESEGEDNAPEDDVEDEA